MGCDPMCDRLVAVRPPPVMRRARSRGAPGASRMIAYRVARAIFGIPIRIAWRLQVLGLDRVPPGPCVFVANHDSLSDTVFAAVAIPRPLRSLAKAELFRSPIGALLRVLGGIPVRR